MGDKAKAIFAPRTQALHSPSCPACGSAGRHSDETKQGLWGNPSPSFQIHSYTETSHGVPLSHLDEPQKESDGPAYGNINKGRAREGYLLMSGLQ